MKVAHFPKLFPKLSETFILNQVTGLLDAGHDLRIIADRPADEPKRHAKVEKYKLDNLITYSRSPQSYSAAAEQVLRTVVRHPSYAGEVIESVRRGKKGGDRLANLNTALETGMNNGNFDVYHAHFGSVGKSWDFLKRNDRFPTSVPLVVSFYGVDASKMIQNNPDTFDELFNITDIITVLSERMKKELTEVGCSEQKIAIQPLPVDMDMFGFKPRSKTEDEKYKLLTVARFDEQKGLRYAVDAIAELTDDYDLSYTIAGDGPLFDDIQARIRDHGIEDSVELLGWLDSDQVQEVMDDAHVFLLPSVTAPDGAKEGTPTVLVEAQAAGLPVVSTYHAGIPEIVEDGESGILVPEKDIDALVTAIKNVLDAPNRWASMGKNGRERIEERHSIPAVVNDLETLYHSASRG